MVEFIDSEEADEDDAKMRLIAQSFSRDVKKWFHGLEIGSINSSAKFNELFLARWWEKKNLLQILANTTP